MIGWIFAGTGSEAAAGLRRQACGTAAPGCVFLPPAHFNPTLTLNPNLNPAFAARRPRDANV
ncbi:MAG: hypothetical protein JWP44_4457 [Mucilaginibacter sp.]|nr:hypothetical protein [Mucilaginibacter sp.]